MATSLTAAPTLDLLESRLRDLELKLGTSLQDSTIQRAHSGNLSSSADFKSVLDKFIRRETERRPPVPSSSRASDATDASKRLSLHEDFRAIDRLLEDLDLGPLVGPTMTGGTNAPLLFRRMEVLACCESIKRDLLLLARIRELTSVGRKSSEINESKVVDCPIVSSDKYSIAVNQDAVQRLEAICFRAANLSKRTALISNRTDQLLTSYSKVMEALDEKIVLAREQIEGPIQ
ncbi:hypothetical protein ACHAW6_003621 [Cyclotella cf. meneghiniana]